MCSNPSMFLLFSSSFNFSYLPQNLPALFNLTHTLPYSDMTLSLVPLIYM